MKQPDHNDIEQATVRLVVAAMRSPHGVLVEYDGREKALFVHHRSSCGGHSVVGIDMNDTLVSKLERQTRLIESRPTEGNHE